MKLINLMISTHKFSRKERKQFKEWLNQQVIRHPTNELLDIYERRILLDHSYLRAEKYDSPEHKDELQEIQNKENNDTVPRNQQNPNFDRLMKYWDNIHQSQTFEELINHLRTLRNFIHDFNFRKHKLDTPYQPNFLNLKKDELDPRLFEQEPEFDNFLNYFLTKFRYQLQDQEFQIFLRLTNRQFDDESSRDCLEAFRESRYNQQDFQELAEQIYEALNQDSSTVCSIDKSEESFNPMTCNLSQIKFTELPDFLNYLRQSFS